MPQPDQLRNVLLAILQKLDPEEAQRELTSDVSRLLETIRLYESRPRTDQFLKSLGDNPEIWANFTPETMVGLNSCLMELGLSTVDRLAPPTEPAQVSPQPPIAPDPPPMQTQLPLRWTEFVFGARERLLSQHSPIPPFSRWILPQHRWTSRWIEAFSVIAADEQDSGSAFLLIPSEDSAESDEAERCWQRRIQAARRLQGMAVSSQIARVMLHAEGTSPCGIALPRSEFARRTLSDRLRADERLSPRECVELGISLCQILGMLNAHGIHVLDISHLWIAFDWSEGQRFTQLLDPTSVIPGPGLLPEWRGAEFGLADAAELANPEPSQVFLIGALVLSLMCDTNDDFLSANFPSGRSASFATLSGARRHACSPSGSIAAPLVADLGRKVGRFPETIDVKSVVDVIQWSVAERREERFGTLLEFGSELRKATR